jgi:hypothetical protein
LPLASRRATSGDRVVDERRVLQRNAM